MSEIPTSEDLENSKPTPLPTLRQDLQLIKGGALKDGASSWLIFDPLNYKYFQIDADTFAILSLWDSKSVEKLLPSASEKLGRIVSSEELEQIFKFLIGNHLTSETAKGSYKDLYDLEKNARQSWFSWLLHNYLFIRIPLVRPQVFLKTTWPFINFLFTRTAVLIVALLGLLGLYFTSRQWDAFANTFLHFLSWEGMGYYFISLVFVKIIHELGHAYMATKYNCRVPTMGIAFLVMMPLLYTDVTDAWRLKERHKRLMIDSAGMFAELYLAAIATLLWAFLPDGTMRSIAFIVATTSWIMSLAINLNPFMKFDGYYIMSDATDNPNLQDRSFAFGKWKLREILFNLGTPEPESISDRHILFMYLYAWAVWIYRFFLFLGIALLVYYFFFKALGIFLFLVEIAWFIVLPVYRELKEWWNMRSPIMKSSRTYVTLTVLGAFIAFLSLPWSGSVHVPSIMTSEKQTEIHALDAGKIQHIMVKAGQEVKEGDILLSLVSPDLEHQHKQTHRNIRLLELRLARMAGDHLDRSDRLVLEEELFSQREKEAGLMKQIKQLVVKAPMDGIVKELDPELHMGRWINSQLSLATIVQPEKLYLRGVLPERALHRISKGDTGKFIPDDISRPTLRVKLEDIAQIGGQTLKNHYLASVYGGPVAVEQDEKKELKATSGQYIVTLSLETGQKTIHMQDMIIKGHVVLDGQPESYLVAMARQVMGVLIRESGA